MKGKAIKFGDNVDTDQIIPAQHLSMLEIADMARFAFEHDVNFNENFAQGDILVAGKNFGCGSSREQAPAVLKFRGVKAVIAKDFARIFYRNSINLGIPLIECEYTDEIGNLDEIAIDFKSMVIKNYATGKTYNIKPYSDFVQNVLDAGGIVNYKLSMKQK